MNLKARNIYGVLFLRFHGGKDFKYLIQGERLPLKLLLDAEAIALLDSGWLKKPSDFPDEEMPPHSYVEELPELKIDSWQYRPEGFQGEHSCQEI